jgi:hypothetical protein
LSQGNVPARHRSSPARKVVSTDSAAAASKKPRRSGNVAKQVAHGTLFAVGLAIAQAEAEEDFFKKKFFESDVVTRLHPQLTRHHE